MKLEKLQSTMYTRFDKIVMGYTKFHVHNKYSMKNCFQLK